MTQFNLADELRRGGTGLLAQAVADLIDAMPGWDARNHERWLLDLQARAAAVPAGNQVKAPTALDEMRARSMAKLVESRPADCDHHAAIHNLNRELIEARLTLKWAHEKNHEAGDMILDLQGQLAESREALARVEAERDGWKTSSDGYQKLALDRFDGLEALRLALGDKLRATEAELRKRDAVIEAARYVVRLHHHPSGQQAAENAFASLMLRLDELEDQAASEAEVAERLTTEKEPIDAPVSNSENRGLRETSTGARGLPD